MRNLNSALASLTKFAFVSIVFVALSWGQTTFPFQIRLQQEQDVLTVANNSTINLVSNAIGRTISINVTILYQGATTAAIPAQPELLGSIDFASTSIGEAPFTLQPNESFSFMASYTATSGARASAQLNIQYTEAPLVAGFPSTAGTITLNLVGSAPDFSVNYALLADGNVLPLNEGGTLQFLPTGVNTTATATLILLNRGSGSGTVDSVSVTGAAFQPLGLPLLPATVPAGTDLRFLIRYSPEVIGTDTGTLEIKLGDRTFAAALEGSGIGPIYTYELLEDSTVTVVQPRQPIPFPDTPVGERTSLIVQVSNTGNADGLVSAIGVSGAGFGFADLPFLPVMLAPNDFFTFTLNFAPSQPGRATGRLRIGADSFDLVGNAIGPRLLYSYTTGSSTTPVQPGEAILFSPLQVGMTSSLELTVRNQGTSTATIATIGINGTSGVFRLENLPPLPATLEPDGSIKFTIFFAPATTGLATASLLIHNQSFALAGFGSPPPALPSHRFTGASGTLEPLSQPAIGISLVEPYPLPVRGVLTLAIGSEAFTPDPAVQFASGGRAVPFTIPANTTEAVFPTGSTQIRFQTGTVAGTITITPSFATQSGFDLTPAAPEPLQVLVPPSAPKLLAVQVSGRTANSFTVVLTGYTTTRSLRTLDFRFAASSGVQLRGAEFSMDITPESTLWFQGLASQVFGGQFSVALPFTITTSVQNPLERIESVTVTASNEMGVSDTFSAPIR